MTKFKVGDIVSVEFPFSDLQTHKRRPGLVLAVGDVDLLVARVIHTCPVTRRIVAIKPLGRDRFATSFDRSPNQARHKIGRLCPEDSRAVAQAWQQLTATVVTELHE